MAQELKQQKQPSLNEKYYQLKFELFGTVQGVFCRWCTETTINNKIAKNNKSKIYGFVQNTRNNTVVGVAQSSSKQSIQDIKTYFCKNASNIKKNDPLLQGRGIKIKIKKVRFDEGIIKRITYLFLNLKQIY